MSAPLDNPPYKSELTDTSRKMTGDWVRWWQPFWSRVRTGIQLVGTAVSLSDQSASVATTTLMTITQSGTYRVNWYARVTTADAVNSSVQLTITWREGSHTSTKAFTALTGNTTSTYDGSVWPFHADSGTLVTYAVAYASNTPQAMRYRIDVNGEQIN